MPGARLHAVEPRPAGGGLAAPREWVDERPELDGLWPAQPAYSLSERWVRPGTVCRSAFWSSPVTAVSSPHPWFRELRRLMAGDERFSEAKLNRGGVRATLQQQRQCIHHGCRPPLSPPASTLTVCVDDLDHQRIARAAPALMKLRPATAPLRDLVALDGTAVLVAEYARNARGESKVTVSLAATPEAQRRARAWLLARGFAVPDPAVSFHLTSTDPRRHFLFYPPQTGEYFELSGR